jgi:hypothetical protein
MTERERERRTSEDETARKRESGQPGGGRGCVDEVERSGIACHACVGNGNERRQKDGTL